MSSLDDIVPAALNDAPPAALNDAAPAALLADAPPRWVSVTLCDALGTSAVVLVIARDTPVSERKGHTLYSTAFPDPRRVPAQGVATVELAEGPTISFGYKLAGLPCGGAHGERSERWIQLNASADVAVVQLKVREPSDDCYEVVRLVVHAPPPRRSDRERILLI